MVKLAYLLDTNVISEPTRAEPDRRLMHELARHDGSLAVSAVTWHEALFGARIMPESKRKRAVLEYLAALALPVLPFDLRCAEWLADERARVRKKGKPFPYADGQIAAVAAVNELTLVTANARDFAGFTGLAVVSWMSRPTSTS